MKFPLIVKVSMFVAVFGLTALLSAVGTDLLAPLFFKAPVIPTSGRFVSYEAPWFCYINNQILLLVSSSVWNPLPQRAMVPGELVFPKVQGLDRETKVNVFDVFEPKNLTKHYAQWDGSWNDDQKVEKVHYMVPENELISKEMVLFGSNITEDYWQYIFTRFVVFGVVFKSSAVAEVMSSLVYKEPMKGLISHSLASAESQHAPIERSIGIHIRTFAKSLSLMNGQECAYPPWYHPFVYMFDCNIGDLEMQAYIMPLLYEANLKGEIISAIYIAIDDPSHQVMANLKQKYGSRVRLLSSLISDKTIELASSAARTIPTPAIRALLENELLRYTRYFMGNFWSTFTQVIAVKRNHKDSILISRYVWRVLQTPGTTCLLALVSLALVSLLNSVRCWSPAMRKHVFSS